MEKHWDEFLAEITKPTPEQLWLQNLPLYKCEICGGEHIFKDECTAPDDFDWSMEEMHGYH